MDSFIQNIAAAFGLKCISISRERFGHLCVTNDGLVLVQKIGGNFPVSAQLENILFQHEVKEYLFGEDFGATDRYFLAAQTGMPYHKVGEDVFTAAAAYDAEQADFSDKSTFLAIITELARLHKCLAQAKFSCAPAKRATASPQEKDERTLQMHRKKIMKAGKFSDFDMLFLEAFEKFEPYLLMPSQMMGYNENVCHSLLKEENIYMGASPIFTNFSMAGYGAHISDLIYIVKRYLKADPKGSLPLDEILETYRAGNPAESFETELFCDLLQYPDKFVKLAKDYYSKKRSFAPKAYISRMEECITRGKALAEWL